MLLGRLTLRIRIGVGTPTARSPLLSCRSWISARNTLILPQPSREMASSAETPEMGTISTPPKQGQLIEHESAVYKTIQEGLAYILVDQKDVKSANSSTSNSQRTTESDRPSVFYNPVQQFNRDLSVLAIRAYGEHAMAVKEKKHKLKNKGRKTSVKRKREEGDQVKDHEQNESLKKACVGDIVAAAAEEEVAPRNVPENGTEDAAEKPANATPKPWVPSFAILDALSASGLRALRYAKEIPFATRVVGNDFSAAAVESMKLNIQHNDVEKIVRPNKGDACAYMYTVGRGQGSPNEPGGIPKFDVVDLDPYGTAATFLDSAVQSVADGGLLCITCTDAAVFAGVGYPEKTFALYGGAPIRGSHSHDGGLRLILHAVATAAGKYGLAIEPMLSLSIDFYARLFVRIHRSAREVKYNASKTMISYNCDYGCGSWKTQYFTEKKSKIGKTGSPFDSYKLAQGPTTAPHCEHCGSKTHVAGPMWGGPLHNPHFIQRILDLTASADKDTYQTCTRIEGMLTTALEEDLEFGESGKEEPAREAESTEPPKPDEDKTSLIPRVDPALVEPYPFFFLLSDLSRVLRTSTVPENQFHGALRHLGYRTSRSHIKPNSVRTDAPWEVIWEIMREWVRRKSPVKEGALTERTPGAGILRRNRQALNPVPGEGPGLGALKRDILSAVDSGRSIAALKTMLEAAMYRAGVQQSAEAAGEPTAEGREEEKEHKDHATTSGSPSPSLRPDPSSLDIVFDRPLGKRGMDAHRKKPLRRYQVNPSSYWGPIARATVSRVPKSSS